MLKYLNKLWLCICLWKYLEWCDQMFVLICWDKLMAIAVLWSLLTLRLEEQKPQVPAMYAVDSLLRKHHVLCRCNDIYIYFIRCLSSWAIEYIIHTCKIHVEYPMCMVIYNYMWCECTYQYIITWIYFCLSLHIYVSHTLAGRCDYW